MKILAVGTHPDDLEIYMFGALAAWRAMGAELVLAVATDGRKGGTIDEAELRLVRQAEARAGATLLGLEPRFLDFPDGELVVDGQLIAALKSLVATELPDLLVTHAPNDYHGDHRALSDALRIAASFQAPLLWADTMMGVGFAPTHYVDITAHAELKAAAIRAHVSQEPEHYVAETLQLNAFRAAQANMRPGSYAEAYRFEPFHPFVDIRELLPPAPRVRPLGDRRLQRD